MAVAILSVLEGRDSRESGGEHFRTSPPCLYTVRVMSGYLVVSYPDPTYGHGQCGPCCLPNSRYRTSVRRDVAASIER